MLPIHQLFLGINKNERDASRMNEMQFKEVDAFDDLTFFYRYDKKEKSTNSSNKNVNFR